MAIHRFEAPDEEGASMPLANALAADLITAGTRVEGIRVQPSTDEIAGQDYRVTGDVHIVGTDLRATIRL